MGVAVFGLVESNAKCEKKMLSDFPHAARVLLARLSTRVE